MQGSSMTYKEAFTAKTAEFKTVNDKKK